MRILNLGYVIFLWLPPVTASLLLLRSFKDEALQVLTTGILRKRLIVFFSVVLICWAATAIVRYWLYKHDPLAHYFLPPKGTFYNQIVFHRLLGKIGLDTLSGAILAGLFLVLSKVRGGIWVNQFDIWAVGFGALAAGWEYALYFLLTSFALTLLYALSLTMTKGSEARFELTPALLISGAVWSLIAGYQYIYVLRVYT